MYLEAFPEWFTEVFSDLVNADAPHSPDSQGSDERVGVFTVLGEGVDSQNGQVRLRLGVIHQVEVDKLLQLKVISLHAVHHVSKEGAARGRKKGALLRINSTRKNI